MTDVAHQNSSIVAREQRGRKVLRRRKAVSAALIVLTISVAAICVMLLTSTLTQSRVSGVVINGANINIQKLNDMRLQWSGLRAQLGDEDKELKAAEALLDDDQAKYETFHRRFTISQKNINDKLNEYATSVQAKESDLGLVLMDYNHFSPVERVDKIKENMNYIIKNHPELEKSTKDVIEAGDIYAKTDDALRLTWNKTLDDDRSKLKGLQAERDALNKSVDNFFSSSFGGLKIEAVDQTKIENAFYDLYTTMPGGEMLNALILMPQDILTLTLVIGMGVLGSVLQMTHALFVNKRQVETVGVYFLRMTVGAITALVIFIVTKAGLPVLADPSKLGGEAPVNPFFISFVAIVSGLMSENAILFVEAQGEKLFATGADAQTPRWARKDLTDKLKEPGRNLEALTSLLGVTQDQIKDWVAGRVAMPENVQTVIASMVGQSPRDIFTDIAPRS
jgi:hypothetical protein